jgi:chemotaxis protein methyltransferase CheR
MTLTGIELPTESQYREYQNFAQDQLGLSLGDDKAYLLHGRLLRRMGELGLDSYADYFQLLAADQEGQERQRFFNAITTTKTGFYREKEHFDLLVREIYPGLRESVSRSELAKIRLWSAG